MTAPGERCTMLERIAAGELAADDPEVSAAAALDPTLREAIAELRALQTRLDRAGSAERAWFAAAERAPAMRPSVVADTIARLSAGVPVRGAAAPAAPRRGWLRYGVVAAAAAAAIALGWFVLAGDSSPPRDDERPLGARPLRLEASARPDGGILLRWRCELPRAMFHVSIHAADDPARRAIHERDEVQETAWLLDAKLTEELRAAKRAYVWRVVATSGGVVATAEDALPLSR